MAFERALVYMTKDSDPIKLETTQMNEAIKTADEMGALWVVAEGVLAGKMLTGQWAKVEPRR